MPTPKTAARAALLLFLAACTGDAGSPVGPSVTGPAQQISDAAHAGAVPGFYFLPPMVPKPAFSGTFDPALSPRVEICELAGASCGVLKAEYTMSTGPGTERVRVDGESYAVNWHTDLSALNVAKTYRISVFAGPVRLGFADVDPVSTGRELKNVNTSEYIPLLDGRTLPIKFRIETGIAGTVTVSPASATLSPGATQQFTATVADLHGNTIATPVSWSTSDAAVAGVDASGMVTAVSTGSMVVTAVSGAASGTASVLVTQPNTPPVAAADSFAAIGNVTVPVAAPGVLANDSDGEAQPLAAVAGTFATAQGGTVTITADGAFRYLSAAGFTGTDSFVYVATDGLAADTNVVQMQVASRVWYVKNDAAAPGDGRDASPFATLAGAQGASGPGETIFVLAGDGTAAGYGEGIELKNGQALTGQGVAQDVVTALNGGALTLLEAGSAPTITRSSAGATVRLAVGNTVQGVNVASTAGAGIAGSGFGTFTAAQTAVSATGGPALDLDGGTVGAAFASLSSTASAGAGLRLHSVGGTLAAEAGSLQGAAGAGVEVAGGAADVAYGGDVAGATGNVVAVTGRTGGTVTLSGSLSASGGGIRVQNNGGGTVAFTGPAKTLNTGASTAVALLQNAGSTIRFAGGGLSITTHGADGFRAEGGGTVIVTGANNAIGTSSGTALRVADTNIGPSGLTFRAITSTGGANGIVLDGTGPGDALQVTGTGNPGSGGTLQGTVGADGTTAGVGVYLNDTRNVRLSWMALSDHANFAIQGSGVSELHLAHTRITGANGNAAGEGSIRLAGVSGASSIVGSRIEGGFENNLRVVNTSGTLDRLTLDGDTIGGNDVAAGDDGIGLDAAGGTFNVTVRNTRFTGTRGDHFQLAVRGAASSDLVFTDNVLSNAQAGNLGGGINVTVAQSAGATYNVSRNSVRDSRGTALLVAKVFGGGAGNGTARGTIADNVIGSAGDANSGSLTGSAIEVLLLSRGAHTSLIRGNQLRGYNNHGILVTAGGASESSTGLVHDGQLSVTVEGNLVTAPGTNPAVSAPRNGVHLNSGTNAGDDYQVCLAFAGNTLGGSGADPAGLGTGQDYRLRHRQNTTVRLPGYAGPSNDATGTLAAGLSGYLTPRTSGAFTLNAAAASTGGGFLGTAGGAGCPLP